mmetsp:Transcript_801/g.1978  ORF Transcript_801/g.1978 Transcript_801/m.1978 type:complete len:228 (-) Transcript_801:2678-3361(-)
MDEARRNWLESFLPLATRRRETGSHSQPVCRRRSLRGSHQWNGRHDSRVPAKGRGSGNLRSRRPILPRTRPDQRDSSARFVPGKWRRQGQPHQARGPPQPTLFGSLDETLLQLRAGRAMYKGPRRRRKRPVFRRDHERPRLPVPRRIRRCSVRFGAHDRDVPPSAHHHFWAGGLRQGKRQQLDQRPPRPVPADRIRERQATAGLFHSPPRWRRPPDRGTTGRDRQQL